VKISIFSETTGPMEPSWAGLVLEKKSKFEQTNKKLDSCMRLVYPIHPSSVSPDKNLT
jgi:hypothetical protein